VVELRLVTPFHHPSTGNVVNNSAASSLDVLLFSTFVTILDSCLGFLAGNLFLVDFRIFQSLPGISDDRSPVSHLADLVFEGFNDFQPNFRI
jgi:hypothetical protein